MTFYMPGCIKLEQIDLCKEKIDTDLDTLKTGVDFLVPSIKLHPLFWFAKIIVAVAGLALGPIRMY